MIDPNWIKKIYDKTEKIKTERGKWIYNYLRLHDTVQIAEKIYKHWQECNQCRLNHLRLEQYFFKIDKELADTSALKILTFIKFTRTNLEPIVAHLFLYHNYRYTYTLRLKAIQTGLKPFFILAILSWIEILPWHWLWNTIPVFILYILGHILDRDNKKNGLVLNDKKYKFDPKKLPIIQEDPERRKAKK